MPYILPESKPVFDNKIKALSELIISGGQLNYVITRLAVLYLNRILGNQPDTDATYTYVPLRDRAGYSLMTERVWSHMCAAAQEWYRIMIAPYEDRKRSENGDVYEP